MSIMSRLTEKLKNMLAAMAYAEAGDFDAVKQILQEASVKLKSEECVSKGCPHQPAAPAI